MPYADVKRIGGQRILVVDGMGWILMIVVGGVAGLIASRITKTSHGLATSVFLGILGAVGFNAVLSAVLGWYFGGIFGQFIVAIIGAYSIILIFQIVRKNHA